MTQDQLNSLDSLVQQYTSQGWTFMPTRTLETDNGKPVDHGYIIKSPRVPKGFAVTFHFDENLLLIVESEALARQNHAAQINAVFKVVAEDMIKEIAALYRFMGKGAQIPTEITIDKLTVPLFESVENITGQNEAT